MNRSKVSDGSSSSKNASALPSDPDVTERVLDKPNDLAKVVFVVKECSEEWSSDEDYKTFVINKVRELFGESKVEIIERCFDAAVDYGFIVAKQNRYEVRDRNELDLSHDSFCFDCDNLVDRKGRQFFKCSDCFRVFHLNCAKEYISGEEHRCNYCKKLDESSVYGVLDQNRVNVLIRYLLDFVKTKTDNSFDKFKLNLEKYQSVFVFKPIDLFEIREKAELNQYKSVSEFEVDFYLFMHNSKIALINFEEINQSYEDLNLFIGRELDELAICVDCYQRNNDKVLQESNKDWICLPCHPPHEAVFVKVKGYSLWPSKLIYYLKDGKKAHIRFFNGDRMDVKLSEIYPNSDPTHRKSLKKNPKMHKYMEMFDKYLELQSDVNYDRTSFEATSDQSASYVQSIEAVVQKSKKRSRKKKKVETITTRASKATTPPVLTNMSLITDIESENSVEDLTSKVPDLMLTEPMEPPVLISIKELNCELKDKRRSVRISSQNRSTEIKQSMTKVKTRDQNKPDVSADNDCEQMEVDSSPQIEEQIDLDLNMSQLPEQPPEQLPEPQNTTSFSPLIISLPDSSDLRSESTHRLSTDSNENSCEVINSDDFNQTYASTSHSNETQPKSSEMSENQSQTNESIGSQSQTDVNQENRLIYEELNRNSKLFKDKYEELMAYKEIEISKIEMQEKIVILNHYHEQHIRELENQLRQTRHQLDESRRQLTESKMKNWCAVCQKLAKYYCCLRYYCSESCQKTDWANGHHLQCLCLPQTDKH